MRPTVKLLAAGLALAAGVTGATGVAAPAAFAAPAPTTTTVADPAAASTGSLTLAVAARVPQFAGAVTACTATTGSIVAVDFGPWSGPIARGCDAGTPAHGIDLLTDTGFTTVGDQHDGPAFICRIGSSLVNPPAQYPTPAQDPCVVTPPAAAYWSYWLAQPGENTWSYSPLGAYSDVPAPGEVEAWVYGGTDIAGTEGLPTFTPDQVRTQGVAAVSAAVPTLAGAARVGGTLTARPGAWAPSGVSLAYQWLRDGATIGGATAASYRLVAADLGRHVAVRVTGARSGYAPAARASAATAAVGAGALGRMAVTVTGPARFGGTLGARAVLPVVPGLRITVSWYRNGRPVGAGTTHRVVAADLGTSLSARATASAPGYASLVAGSAAVPVARDTARLGAAVPSHARAGSRPVITVTLRAGGSGVRPTGALFVYVDRTRLTVTVTAHSASPLRVTLPKLARGSHAVRVSYRGSSSYQIATTPTYRLRVA